MPNKINKKICLLAAIAAVFAGVLIWSAFFLQFGKIGEISDNTQKEHLDSLVREQRSQRILEMGKELGDMEKNKNDMRAMLVDKDNAVPFLKTLESIATATGNEIKIGVADLSKIKSQTAKKPAIQESDVESKKDLQNEDKAQKSAKTKNKAPDFSNQLGFSIELSGNYGSTVDFFTKLESMPYFAQVYNFQITPAPKRQTAQTAGAEEEDKKIKSTITIGAYTNAAK